MKRVTGKFRNILNVSKEMPESEDPSDRTDAEYFSSDAFFHRMFERDIYLHISEISVAMVGVCLTGVSILNVDQDINNVNTYIDDFLAIDAFVFLTSCLLSYWVIKVSTKSARNMKRVGNIANFIFLIGMVLMVVICACIVLQGDYSPKISSEN